jgi:pyruvate kinase
MAKRTKIVATIGPATESQPTMERLIASGMNVARLNFSHGTYKHHSMLIKNLRAAAKAKGVSIAIMQDLQGPRIRISKLDDKGIKVSKNQNLILVPEDFVVPKKTTDTYVKMQYPALSKEVKVGHAILIDDAVIELQVVKISKQAVYCKVVIGGTIKAHKGMNFPDSDIKCPPVTAKDLKDLEFGIKSGVDFVSLSFVKDAKDVINLRKRIFVLEKKYNKNKAKSVFKLERAKKKGKIGGVHVRIISKIERREAIDNFDQILEATDAVMIARGDLGIELPFESLPLIQKTIIDKCRRAGKQVIVATQMLDSMIRNPLPTRAEVSDVANAILDGTDAIMLSGETAGGKYPLKAVQAMSRIAKNVEGRMIKEQEAKEGEFKNLSSVTQVMSFMAQDLAEDVTGAKLIVCATTSGFTARNISRFKSQVPLVAVAPADLTVNQLGLSWGVTTYPLAFTSSFDTLLKKIKKLLVVQKLVKKGDVIVVVAGHPFGFKGQTNLIKLETI